MAKLELEALKSSLAREKQLQNKRLIARRFIIALLMLVLAVIGVFYFLLGLVVVNGEAMTPALQNGDLAFYSRSTKGLVTGDIIIIQDPVKKGKYISRVVALEGNRVDISDVGVTVNGNRLKEPYLYNTTTLAYDLPFPQTVAPHSLFVLGDNRMLAKDSRHKEVGMVNLDCVKGKLIYVARPFR